MCGGQERVRLVMMYCKQKKINGTPMYEIKFNIYYLCAQTTITAF
jgi:hypothetical protein